MRYEYDRNIQLMRHASHRLSTSHHTTSHLITEKNAMSNILLFPLFDQFFLPFH